MKYSKKIGIIGIRGLPARHGAFDRFVEQFVSNTITKKKKLFFYVACDISFKKYKFKSKNVRCIYVFRGISFFILLSYLSSIIKMYIRGVRCFLFFGYGAAPFFTLLRLFNCNIICNPDGIEWRRPESKIKKLYFRYCEKLVSNKHIQKIYDSKVIERYYKINYSANGKTVYYPSVFEKYNSKVILKKNFERFYIIGRLLEENNTEMIVKAFKRLELNKKLYIIGKSNNYFEKKIIPLISGVKNIKYLGPIYDQEKLFGIFRHFNFYIHGHSVGGTNPTLIEAVNLQKQIISFNTYFNKEILNDNAAYFKNENDLYNIIVNNKHHKIKKPLYKKEYSSNYINNAYFEYLN